MFFNALYYSATYAFLPALYTYQAYKIFKYGKNVYDGGKVAVNASKKIYNNLYSTKKKKQTWIFSKDTEVVLE